MTRKIEIEIPDQFSVTIGGESMTFNAADVAHESFETMLWHGWRKLNDAFAGAKSVASKDGGTWLESDARTMRTRLYDAVLDGSIANTVRGGASPGLTPLQTRIAKLALAAWKGVVDYDGDWKSRTTAERYRAILDWLDEPAMTTFGAKVTDVAKRQLADEAAIAELDL
jgi:hypothetical protein